MEAIAVEAGVAVGTLYRHHPTKSALLHAVLTDSAEQLAADAEQALEAVGEGAHPGEELERLFRAYADHSASDRAVKAAAAELGEPVSSDPGAYPEGGPQRRAGRAIEGLLAASRRAGAVRDDVTLADLVLLLGALPGPEVDPSARARFVDIVLAGLRAQR